MPVALGACGMVLVMGPAAATGGLVRCIAVLDTCARDLEYPYPARLRGWVE